MCESKNFENRTIFHEVMINEHDDDDENIALTMFTASRKRNQLVTVTVAFYQAIGYGLVSGDAAT